MTNKEALEILVSKTSLLNNTCSSLNNCIKSKKCVLNIPCETCDDYKLVMTIKQDLDRLDRLEKLEKDLKTTNEFNKKLREENSKYKKTIKILKEVLENE